MSVLRIEEEALVSHLNLLYRLQSRGNFRGNLENKYYNYNFKYVPLIQILDSHVLPPLPHLHKEGLWYYQRLFLCLPQNRKGYWNDFSSSRRNVPFVRIE